MKGIVDIYIKRMFFFLSHYNTFNVPYGILLIHPFYLSSIEATTLIKIYLSYKKYA